ncbi:MAG: hypothetical protein GY853_01520 [PVC group bacterium]|nr:hypothetical protein [PVC group bacterium]
MAISEFRPINQWNKGKKAEAKERKEYSPEEIEKSLLKKTVDKVQKAF